MTMPMTASDVLEREFLAVRAKLIEVAATLDRIDRAKDPISEDPRLDNIRRGLELLAGDHKDRAEQLQLIFSLPYEENWRND